MDKVLESYNPGINQGKENSDAKVTLSFIFILYYINKWIISVYL
jgi:hypothetical protein